MPIRIGVKVDTASGKVGKLAKDLNTMGESTEKVAGGSKKMAAGLKTAGTAVATFSKQTATAEKAAERLYAAYKKIASAKAIPLGGPPGRGDTQEFKEAKEALANVKALSAGLKVARAEFYAFQQGMTQAGGVINVFAKELYNAQTAAFAQEHANRLLSRSETELEAAMGRVIAVGEKGYIASRKRVEAANLEAAATERLATAKQRAVSAQSKAAVSAGLASPIGAGADTTAAQAARKQAAGLSQKQIDVLKREKAAADAVGNSYVMLGRNALAAGDRVAKMKATQRAGGMGTGGVPDTKKVNAAVGSMVDLRSSIRGAAGAMGVLWASYGSVIPLMTAFAAVAGAKSVVTLGADLEYTATYVAALGDEASGATMSVEELETALLSLDNLRTGPTALALGMKEFAKAGVEAGDSIQHIEEMSRFATIAELELNDAVTLVIGQSKAFDQSFSDSANMIAAAAMSSATTIEQMGTSLSYTTELASVSGIAFDEVATAMAMMANAGIRGSKAGTALRTSILKMQAPSKKLGKMLDELGITWSAFKDDGQVKDLRAMFTELERVTANMPDQQRVALLKELFGLRAMKGGATILKGINDQWDPLNKKIREAGQGTTFVSEKYAQMTDTLVGQTDLLKVALEEFAVSLSASDVLKNWVKSLGDSVTDMTDIVNEAKKLAGGIRDLGLGEETLIGQSVSLPEVDKSKMPEWLQDITSSKNPYKMFMKGNKQAIMGVNQLIAAFKEKRLIQGADRFGGEADVAGLKGAEAALTKNTNAIKNDVTLLKEARLAQLDAINGMVDDRIKAIHGLKAAEAELMAVYGEAKAEYYKSAGGTIEFRTKLVGLDELDTKLAKVKNDIEQEHIKLGIERPDLDPFVQEVVKAEQALILADEAAKNLKATTDLLNKAKVEIDFYKTTEGMNEASKANYKLVQEVEALAIKYKMTDEQMRKHLATVQELAKWRRKESKETKKAREALDKYKDTLKEVASHTNDTFSKLDGFKDQELELEMTIKAGDSSEADALLAKYKKLFKDSRGGKVAGSDKQLAALAKQYREIDTEKERMQKLQLARAKEFETLADLAAKKGTAGYKEQVHYLEKARAIYESMDTSVDKVTKKQVAAAKQAFEYQQRITGGGKRAYGDAGKAYDKAKADYIRLAKAEREGKADPKKETDALKKKLGYLKQNSATEQAAARTHLQSLNTRAAAEKKIAEGYGATPEAINKAITESALTIDNFHKAWIADIKTVQEGYGSLEVTAGGKPVAGGNEIKAGAKTDYSAEEEQLKLGKLAVAEEKKLKAAKEQTGKAAEKTTTEAAASIQAAEEQTRISQEAADKIVAENSQINAAVAGATELIVKIGNEWTNVTTKIEAAKTETGNAEKAAGDAGTAAEAANDAWIGTVQDLIKFYGDLTKEINAASAAAASGNYGAGATGGARAAGGPVSSDKSYIVGEKGPELFSPTSSGHIIPNNKLTTNGENVNINLSVNNEPPVVVQGTRQSARDIAAMFSRQQRLASA